MKTWARAEWEMASAKRREMEIMAVEEGMREGREGQLFFETDKESSRGLGARAPCKDLNSDRKRWSYDGLEAADLARDDASTLTLFALNSLLFERMALTRSTTVANGGKDTSTILGQTRRTRREQSAIASQRRRNGEAFRVVREARTSRLVSAMIVVGQGSQLCDGSI